MADSAVRNALETRSEQQCELCGSDADLGVHPVDDGANDADRCLHACGVCRAQLSGDDELDANHWTCLQGSIWSVVPAVQVVSYRLLGKLADEDWAQDLLDQVYLEPEVLAWAQVDHQETESDAAPTLDSNGAVLQDGDAVTLIKDLDVKGTSFVAKRGTLVKSIRLTDNPEHVEGRVNKVALVLKTCFLKKA
jgi:protein PhnA